MSIQGIGLKAYSNALQNFTKVAQENKATELAKPKQISTSFAETLGDSLGKVNSMQKEKNAMIQSFASGENQNVHELMISMQKAGLAINLTSAVRNKVLEAYRELSRMQF